MGHDVTTMTPVSNRFLDNKAVQLYKMVKQYALPGANSSQENWLLKKIRTGSFDLVVTLTQALSESVLQQIKQKNITTVAWWGDTPANMKKTGLLVDGWDKIYIKDANAVNKMSGVGLNVELMHEAMNPDWHKPLYQNINDQVVVAGSFYNYRNYLVHALIDRGCKITAYGRPPSRWAYKNVLAAHTNTYVTREAKSLVFGEGLACLNSTDMSEFNSLNCRAFEIAGAEGLQFLEYRPMAESCFDLDKELKTFTSIDEILDLVEWATKYPNEALQVRQKGRKRVLAEHTYQHRLEKIITDIC